jgi:hypothetical protein
MTVAPRSRVRARHDGVMPRLPDVFTEADLPEAELQAMRLDGLVYPLGSAWCPLGTAETPGVRARAVLADRPPRLIAELGTAAWIWGAAPLLPRPLTFCVDVRARARLRPTPQAAVRELVLHDGDVVALGDALVTAPVRTAVDLARSGGADAVVLRALAAAGGFDAGDALASLAGRGPVTGADRARRSLAEALGR